MWSESPSRAKHRSLMIPLVSVRTHQQGSHPFAKRLTQGYLLGLLAVCMQVLKMGCVREVCTVVYIVVCVVVCMVVCGILAMWS